MTDIERIKNHYKNHSDEKIKLIALHDSQGIKDRTIPILIEEIKRRGLDNQLIEWIKAQKRILSIKEMNDIKHIVQNCNCTICSSKKQKIFGYRYTTRAGLLLFSYFEDRILIVCKDCGEKKRKTSFLITLFFGWFSPKSFFHTPFVIFDKIKSYKNENEKSNRIIEKFILKNIGNITIHNDSKEIIQELIDSLNKKK